MSRPVRSMSPGQRWTAALALTLALAIGSVGTPASSIAGSDRVAPASSDFPLAMAAPTPSLPAPLAPTLPPVVVTGPGAHPIVTPASIGASAAGPGPISVRVVAAVRPEDRDDASAFLSAANLKWSAVTVDDRRSLCSDLAAAGDLILTGDGLPDEVTSCLLRLGKAVIAYDEHGSRADGKGVLLSTRVAVDDSLAELASVLRPTGYLSDRVAVVTTSDRRAIVDQALPRMRAAGVDVVATVEVDDPTAVTGAVLQVSGAGARSVVFALPAQLQALWVAQATVLNPGTRYVVADAADAVVNAAYPPGFDGLAYTAVRVPWYRSTHGVTPTQAACERRRAASVTSYLWCENTLLAGTIATAVARGTSVPAAAREVRGPSPLTSDLAPRPTARWGPTQTAVLAWAVDCGCWRERSPFVNRPGRER